MEEGEEMEEKEEEMEEEMEEKEEKGEKEEEKEEKGEKEEEMEEMEAEVARRPQYLRNHSTRQRQSLHLSRVELSIPCHGCSLTSFVSSSRPLRPTPRRCTIS